jgi:polycystin 1L2
MNETQCLCNHLTSFGGDFVVPPNSIDWDAVGAGFSNLSENPVVFAVVVSIIGVYFILLVWIRRLDKKDLEEVNEYECLFFEKYTEPL